MNQALVVVGALVFSAAAVLGYFGWQELRGIGPAVRAPSRDIVEVLEHVNTSGSQIDFPLVLPENFGLKIFAADLIKPRVIIEDPRGVVLVSIPGEGRVVALPDADSDGVADSVIEVLSDLDRPHGLALECAEAVVVGEGDTKVRVVRANRVVNKVEDRAFGTTRTNDEARNVGDLLSHRGTLAPHLPPLRDMAGATRIVADPRLRLRAYPRNG